MRCPLHIRSLFAETDEYGAQSHRIYLPIHIGGFFCSDVFPLAPQTPFVFAKNWRRCTVSIIIRTHRPLNADTYHPPCALLRGNPSSKCVPSSYVDDSDHSLNKSHRAERTAFRHTHKHTLTNSKCILKYYGIINNDNHNNNIRQRCAQIRRIGPEGHMVRILFETILYLLYFWSCRLRVYVGIYFRGALGDERFCGRISTGGWVDEWRLLFLCCPNIQRVGKVGCYAKLTDCVFGFAQRRIEQCKRLVHVFKWDYRRL